MSRSADRRRTWITAAALTVGVSGAAVPVLAQMAAGEVVVTARYQGRDLRSLSVPVSYRDLDLTTAAGREALEKRVKAAADDACQRLGEGRIAGTALPSCERDAVNGAARQEQFAFAQAKSGAKPATSMAVAPAASAEAASSPAAATMPTTTSGPPAP